MEENSEESYKDKLIKRSYNYSLDIIKFIDVLDKKDITIQVISRQLLRSTTSVGANIIEAQAGSSPKDFVNYLNHALKSANESKFWLGLLKDSEKADGNRCDNLLSETSELANILGSSIIKLRKKHQ